MPKTTNITTANSVDDIKNIIKYLKAKIITLEKEFSFLIDEISKEQGDCQKNVIIYCFKRTRKSRI
ncbi:hypothetical protein [Spiroplasma endosymbiont of Nebria brevicollis]|uniref:hypothetical protein n=1 Tax=Spiroplasma endosymbiont of Nebria brevicollis TaxID=3066284 RepID=UPI00313C8D15